jgi:predicted PurR-regulated permease PerM
MPSVAPRDKNRRVRRICLIIWSIIGLGVICVALGYVLGHIWTPVSVVLAAAFVVFILRVPVAWMERHGVPRGIGAAISYLGALVIIALILFIFVPLIASQLTAFIKSVPSYVNDLLQWFNTFYDAHADFIQSPAVQQVVNGTGIQLTAWASGLAPTLTASIIDIGNQVGTTLFVAFISIIVGFWVLKDLPFIGHEMLALFGPRYRNDAKFVSLVCARSLGGYIKAMVVSCICVGIMTFIVYSILGLPYPLVMALFAGLMVFVPFVGPLIGWIVNGLLALFVSPLACVIAVVLSIAAQLINDNLISPKVMSSSVDLHPGVILVAVIMGGALGGAFGMLCAVPLTAAAKRIFIHYYERYTHRRISSPSGVLFREKDNAAPDKDTGRLRKLFSRRRA